MTESERRPSLGEQVANIERVLRTGVRFCVQASNGSCSGVWKFWVNNSDFYIAARPLAGSIKISLHESGHFRMAFLQKEIEAMRRRGQAVPQDRALFKWRRPENVPGAAVCTVTIRFPVAFIRGRPKKGTAKKPLITFELDAECKVAEVGFFYTREKPEIIGPTLEEIGEPLFYTQLPNGETVWMIGRFTDPNPRDVPHPDSFASADTKRLEAESDGSDIVAIAMNAPKDGEGLTMREFSGLTVSNGQLG